MRKIRSMLITAGAVGAAAVGGGALANAATSTTTTSGSSSGAASQAAPPSNMPLHGSARHEDAEKPVTGRAATEAKAAAVKALGGGTAGDVTTDYTQSGYEVTVTKSDGSTVEVHLDSSFNVLQGGPGH
jgi:hypothetical protein